MYSFFLNMKKILLLFVLGLSGCVTSIDSEVENNKTVTEDKEYYQVYKKYAQTSEAFRDFESKYAINTVYLSREFMQAFALRYEYLYKKENIVLTASENKLNFFVSVFSPEKTSRSLHDPKVWSIYVVLNGKRYYAETVKHFSEKDPWRAFFPQIITWSEEYLVTVPIDGVEAGVESLTNFTVNFAHADAHLSFPW